MERWQGYVVVQSDLNQVRIGFDEYGVRKRRGDGCSSLRF